MSKVQPNHNRGIMQTGLGQPPNHSVANTRRSFGSLRKSRREWGGKKDAKTSYIMYENCFFPHVDICIVDHI